VQPAQQEAEFLRRLAGAPGDGALALVYADWLMEQGDARGEWIATVNSGAAPSAQKLSSWISRQGAQWLGPLAPYVHVGLCAWERGFLRKVVFKDDVPVAAWAEVAMEPRLLTVTDLTIEATHVGSAARFLSQPVLAGVKRFAGRPELFAEPGADDLAFRPGSLGVILDTLDNSVEGVLAHRLFGKVREIRLIAAQFVQPPMAADFAHECSRFRSLVHVERAELELRFGTLETATVWLNADLPARLEASWGLKYADVTFTRYHAGNGRWGLEVGLGTVEGSFSIKARLGVVASVLSQWLLSALDEIDVCVPAEVKLDDGDFEMLRIAARRLPFLKALNVQGRRLLP
jgi:uncharacterized protein (TIGR02996 family)